MTIKINAASRLSAAKEEVHLDLHISGSPQVIKRLVNMLAGMEYNSAVGHSTVHAMFVDGDGSDRFKVVGLPDNNGAKMAAAASSYGDNVVEFTEDSARAWTVSLDVDVEKVRKTLVYPICKDGSYEGLHSGSVVHFTGNTDTGKFTFYENAGYDAPDAGQNVSVLIKDGKFSFSPIQR